MVWVTIQLGKGYMFELKKRMRQAKISQNELARAMKMDAAQVNRWFTDNPERQVTPTLETAERIEEVMYRLEKKAASA